MSVSSPIKLLLYGALWLGAIATGFGVLLDYQTAPGVPANPPAQWPAKGPVARQAGRPNLLLMAHPRCPCSRASIGELAWIMTRTREKTSARVYFFRPAGFPEGWEKGELWKSASAIPGVETVSDPEGRIARFFNAATSGETLLYDAAGRLVFSGGITGARGHAGDNDGREAVLSLLLSRRADAARTPVFGCALADPEGKKDWRPWKW